MKKKRYGFSLKELVKFYTRFPIPWWMYAISLAAGLAYAELALLAAKALVSFNKGELYNSVILGYVTQECVMYAGTLRENLTQGIERSVTDEDLDRACEGAGILDFVRMQPEGYDLAVGEGGASLSGGQRQRFTVARALLRQPDYLLLDEATAAMDIEGKDLVWTSIRQRMAGKTVVFVAHDAQTVRNADYIIVLRDGKAEAAGDRDTMLASNPYCLEMMEQTGKEAG